MSAAPASFLIAERFCGPPDSANGGLLGGSFAAAAFAPNEVVEVSFLAPCPLASELEVHREDQGAELRHGDTAVARARATTLDLDVPAAPAADAIRSVAGRCRAFATHPFPRCFVCGPERADGLRILPGPVGSLAAALWTPDREWADDQGHVRGELLWAALDCTSIFSFLEDAALAARLEPMVLGRMVARIDRPIPAGAELRVLGWTEAHEGRKARCGTALVDERGAVLARARCTWISLAGRDGVGG